MQKKTNQQKLNTFAAHFTVPPKTFLTRLSLHCACLTRCAALDLALGRRSARRGLRLGDRGCCPPTVVPALPMASWCPQPRWETPRRLPPSVGCAVPTMVGASMLWSFQVVFALAGLSARSLGFCFLPPLPPSPPLGLLEELAIEESAVQVGRQVPPEDHRHSMLLPPTGGPPSEEGPRSGSGESDAHSGPLKQSGGGRGAQALLGQTRSLPWSVQLQVNPSSLRPCKRAAQAPKHRCST